MSLLTSIRNFETHKDDAFPSAQFELAKRKLAEPISGLSKATGKYYEKVLLRLNTKSGSVEYIELDLSKHVILTHPDPSDNGPKYLRHTRTPSLIIYIISVQERSEGI